MCAVSWWSTIPSQSFIEVLRLDGLLKAMSLGTYITSSAVLLSTAAISGPPCTTLPCSPSIQSLPGPCSPFIIHCFSMPADCCWSLVQSSKTVFPSFLIWIPKNLHWSFPAISDLPETVGISPLTQKMYHPCSKDTPCHLHAEKFWCGCDQIKFIAVSK